MTLKIGEKIKQLRRTQNVTQEKLADYLNISYQAVSKWENGLHCRDHIFDMQPYS
jgi:DNA-binding transcriptional regulator YiaG